MTTGTLFESPSLEPRPSPADWGNTVWSQPPSSESLPPAAIDGFTVDWQLPVSSQA